MRDDNPEVRRIRAQIVNYQSILGSSVEAARKQAAMGETELRSRIGRLEKELSSYPKTFRSLLGIQRKAKLNEELYLFLLQKQAETSIALASNVPSNRVVDIAKTDKDPIKPNSKLNYGIAFLLGLFLPILYIVLKEYLNTRIQSRADVEALTSVPMVGGIGHNERDSTLVVINHPKSAIAESFRSLRYNLNFFSDPDQTVKDSSKVYMVTSSIGGEGKTFCSINLSLVLALTGAKTVLLGVDLRKPKIYNDFALSNTVGLSNYLAGLLSLKEVVQHTTIENLDIISAGPIPPNPSELLLGKRFGELINELRKT